MTKEFSEVKQWTVSTLIETFEENPSIGQAIIIPKFQRNLVWKKDQKKNFIDSIKRGFPFGALLLYRKEVSENIEYYLLIDGLQRATTIKGYTERPTTYFSKIDVPEEVVNLVISNVDSLEDNEETSEDVKVAIADWINSLNGFEETDNFSTFRLITALTEKLCLDLNLEAIKNLEDKLREYTAKIKRDSDISKVQVPVIIYHGDESNLSTIFERINSKGTTLNKYQIFAATWNDKTFNINNREIIEMIKSKYDKSISQGLEIENYDSDTIFSSQFTLFEYLFGLSKLLRKKFPQLFGPYDDDRIDSTDSIAFNLVTICCWLPLNKMKDLKKDFPFNNIDKFEKALFDSVSIVYSSIAPVLTLKANKKNGAREESTLYHSENQIISYIGTVFHLKYKGPFDVKASWNSKKEKLIKNIRMYYLFDILREFWRGSGDSKLSQIVLDLDLDNNSRYLKEIPKQNWENIFGQWFDNQLTRSEKSRVTIKPSDILFLKYLYAHRITVFEDRAQEYEIEHLYPVGRLKKAANSLGGLPISCVSNLALLEKDINRDKKDSTIKEYYDSLIENGVMSEGQVNNELERLKEYLFVDPDELIIIKEDGQDIITIEWYITFLKKRFNILKQRFYDLNHIPAE